MKLSPLHFQLSIFIIEKRLSGSASHRVGDSLTRRVVDSLTRRVGESVNMTVLDYSCGLQSLPYTKNHHFTFKALIFLHQKFIYKKGASDKSSEDINVGESVSMNLAPLYF